MRDSHAYIVFVVYFAITPAVPFAMATTIATTPSVPIASLFPLTLQIAAPIVQLENGATFLWSVNKPNPQPTDRLNQNTQQFQTENN